MNPSVELKTIAVDFTDVNIYKRVALELSSINIGVLINNVGMNVGFCHPFTDIEDEHQIDNIINCNVVSVARMTHMIVPSMIRRRSGVIINVSSLSAAFATPLAVIYGATKVSESIYLGRKVLDAISVLFCSRWQAFVDKFSRDLERELRGTGVVVQTVLPGFVMTNMVKDTTCLNTSSWCVPDPDHYVRANLCTLGIESRTASFWLHKIEVRFSS